MMAMVRGSSESLNRTELRRAKIDGWMRTPREIVRKKRLTIPIWLVYVFKSHTIGNEPIEKWLVIEWLYD